MGLFVIKKRDEGKKTFAQIITLKGNIKGNLEGGKKKT